MFNSSFIFLCMHIFVLFMYLFLLQFTFFVLCRLPAVFHQHKAPILCNTVVKPQKQMTLFFIIGSLVLLVVTFLQKWRK